MRTFLQFCEAQGDITDPKQYFNYLPDPPGPEDDDYDPFTASHDDEDEGPVGTSYRGIGRSGQYPKAYVGVTTGRLQPGRRPRLPRGMHLTNPFSNKEPLPTDPQERYQHLAAKQYAGEPLSREEQEELARLARMSAKHIVKHGVFTKRPMEEE